MAESPASVIKVPCAADKVWAWPLAHRELSTHDCKHLQQGGRGVSCSSSSRGSCTIADEPWPDLTSLSQNGTQAPKPGHRKQQPKMRTEQGIFLKAHLLLCVCTAPGTTGPSGTAVITTLLLLMNHRFSGAPGPSGSRMATCYGNGAPLGRQPAQTHTAGAPTHELGAPWGYPPGFIPTPGYSEGHGNKGTARLCRTLACCLRQSAQNEQQLGCPPLDSPRARFPKRPLHLENPSTIASLMAKPLGMEPGTSRTERRSLCTCS